MYPVFYTFLTIIGVIVGALIPVFLLNSDPKVLLMSIPTGIAITALYVAYRKQED